MRRGEIRIINLDPGQGSEAGEQRPAVIVSSNGANAAADRTGRGVLTVVPVTTNTARVYPFQVLLRASDTGLSRNCKAQAEQVRAVAVSRVGQQVATLPPKLLTQLDAALRLHLGL